MFRLYRIERNKVLVFLHSQDENLEFPPDANDSKSVSNREVAVHLFLQLRPESLYARWLAGRNGKFVGVSRFNFDASTRADVDGGGERVLDSEPSSI